MLKYSVEFSEMLKFLAEIFLQLIFPKFCVDFQTHLTMHFIIILSIYCETIEFIMKISIFLIFCHKKQKIFDLMNYFCCYYKTSEKHRKIQ